jgi:hypothetical protein
MQIHKVQEGVYRGEAPKNYEELCELSKRNIGTWLHLENGFQKHFSWANAAADWQIRLRSAYLYMPMSNIRFPRKDVLAWCASTIQYVACIPSHSAIFVSCKHGKDRTGIVFAYWRVVHCGWTPAAAWSEAEDVYGMHSFYIWLGWKNKFLKLFEGK